MDFTRIKNLVRGNGDKVILVEDGEPAMVVMSFADYEKLIGLPQGVNGGAAPAYEEDFAVPQRRGEWQANDGVQIQSPETEAPETEFIADDPPPAPAG
ncbi:MAG: hypothetical protein AAB533_01360, partial [Patescibacteria group bacterium]